MSAGRVKSKNLFNFQLQGFYDDDVAAHDAKTQQISQSIDPKQSEHMQKLFAVNDEETNKEFVVMFRGLFDMMVKANVNQEPYTTANQNVDETILKVSTNHCGDFEVPVFQYTPKKFQDKGVKRAAYIYAHGGGGFALDAATFKPALAYFADELDVVVFNVDYRLAPETKCPNNVKDFYEAIKYVVKNADELGIDARRIAIGGESGGGYICLGAMVLLAQREESALVRMAIVSIPMVDDYSFADVEPMTKEERESAPMMRKIWKHLIADDWEKQKSDPLLFPGKASDELLQKFVPTVLDTVEFDMYITEATRLANRLRRAGRLLDQFVIPGGKHGNSHMPNMKCFTKAIEARKLVFKNYLHDIKSQL